MIDWKTDFRHEFGDNQPDLEEFIGKVFEGVEKQHRKFQKALAEDFRTACEEMRLGEGEVYKIIEKERLNLFTDLFKKMNSRDIAKAICQIQEGRGE